MRRIGLSAQSPEWPSRRGTISCRAVAPGSPGKGHPQEIVNRLAHHQQFRHLQLFERSISMKRPVLDEVIRPPTSAHGTRFIVLWLGYLRERTDIDMVAQYQCTEWGRAKSGTRLAELSALAARIFKSKRDRDTFRQRRVTVLRERLIAYKLRSRFSTVHVAEATTRPSQGTIHRRATAGREAPSALLSSIPPRIRGSEHRGG